MQKLLGSNRIANEAQIYLHIMKDIDIHKAQEKFIVLELHHPGLELTTCGTHSRSNELPQRKPLGYLAI